MIAMDIRFAPGSMERLRSSMRRVETELGKSSAMALKWAARAVAMSVGMSTVVSEKYRLFKEVEPSPAPKFKRKHAKKSGKLKTYSVLHYVKGEPEFKEHTATGIPDLRRRVLKIGRRGMCKRLWRSAISVAANRGTGRGKYFSVDGNTKPSAADQHITMTNALRYSAIAIKPQEVTTALDRAASGVIKRLDETLKRQRVA